MNGRFVFFVVMIVLILINGIVLLFAKFMKMNLQVSQKYEEIDLTSEIERMSLWSEISLIFLLILSAMFIGVWWTMKISAGKQ